MHCRVLLAEASNPIMAAPLLTLITMRTFTSSFTGHCA